MKKIMCLIIAAVATFVASAATVSWSATNVYGTDGATKNSSIGYLFAVAGDVTTDAVKTILAGSDAAAVQSYFSANSQSSVTPTTAGTYSGPKTDYASGEASFFAVIFDGATIADSSNYYMTTVSTVTVPGSGNKVVAFGNQSSATFGKTDAYTAAGWATPEPTSGMLLLLGGALLALRRKRK